MPRANPSNRSSKGRRCSVEVPGIGTIDGRTREAKLYGQAVADLVSDLGGNDVVTRAELELVRRAAGLAVLATLAEARLIAGEQIDVVELTSIGNAQRRLLATLGLERRSRDVTPRLSDYVSTAQDDAA